MTRVNHSRGSFHDSRSDLDKSRSSRSLHAKRQSHFNGRRVKVPCRYLRRLVPMTAEIIYHDAPESASEENMPRDYDDIWLRIPLELRSIAVDHQNRIEMHAPAWTRERLAEAMRLPLHEMHGSGGRFWLYYHEPYRPRVEMNSVSHYGD